MVGYKTALTLILYSTQIFKALSPAALFCSISSAKSHMFRVKILTLNNGNLVIKLVLNIEMVVLPGSTVWM